MKKKEYLITENAGSICIHDLEMDSVCDFWKNVEDITEPFKLSKIALDAFNTANKCGLLPSELLEQRDELLSGIKTLLKHYSNMYEFETGCDSNSVIESAWDTINQIEQ